MTRLPVRFLEAINTRLGLKCQVVRRGQVSCVLLLSFQHRLHCRRMHGGLVWSWRVKNDKLDALFTCVVCVGCAKLTAQIAFDERIWH